jgi:hypothetical protein
MKMTTFMPSPKQLEAAKKLALGYWQEYLIDYGYDLIPRGKAVLWAGRYRQSLLNLCKRLNEAGIEAKAFSVNQRHYCLVLSKGWICLCERVEAILPVVSRVYAALKEDFLPKATGEETRKVMLQLLRELRSFIKECKSALITVAYNYSLALRRCKKPKEAYTEAVRVVEAVERLWSEKRGYVGILLL